jgi:predicted ferric reductase
MNAGRPTDGPAPAAPFRPSGLRPTLFFSLYGAILALPVGFAILQGYPSGNIFRALSTGLVMVGYAMLLLQFLLSGRFEHLSGRTGIDRTMRFHQVAAWAILGLIVAHPFLYAVARLSPDPRDALDLLVRMFTAPRLQSGVMAWVILILLVAVAALRDRLPFRYETWRLGHGLMSIALAGLGTHHTLSVGHYSAERWLALFWAAATVLALLAMLNIYVLKPIAQRRQPYSVVSNRNVAHRMWEVTIAPAHGPALSFAAGQFAWANFGHSPFSLTEHPFSISSAPADRPRISFIIKESGDFTNRIGRIAAGTRAYLDGPHGNFTLAGRSAKSTVFIAGGVGFAPILSMLRQMKAERDPRPVRLIYGNRIETQILYRDETFALKEGLDFAVEYILSEPPPGWQGRVGELTPELLATCLDAIGGEDGLYFVCGPPPMMTNVERTLIRRGVPRRRIVTERFKYD